MSARALTILATLVLGVALATYVGLSLGLMGASGMGPGLVVWSAAGGGFLLALAAFGAWIGAPKSARASVPVWLVALPWVLLCVGLALQSRDARDLLDDYGNALRKARAGHPRAAGDLTAVSRALCAVYGGVARTSPSA